MRAEGITEDDEEPGHIMLRELESAVRDLTLAIEDLAAVEDERNVGQTVGTDNLSLHREE